MSIIALFIYIVILALLGYLAVWVLGMLAPEHPKLIDNIVWVLVVLCIVIVTLNAVGLTGGLTVPRIR